MSWVSNEIIFKRLCKYLNAMHVFSSLQLLSCVQLFATPWTAACQASLSITISQSSLKLTSIESVMPSNHLILCHPLFLLPSIPPSTESFPMSQLFAWGGQSTGVSALASSFQRTPRTDLLQNGLVGSPWSPRDSQESLASFLPKKSQGIITHAWKKLISHMISL